tara:strand:- start:1460 stop:2683 length:1224 start_codon:yes stop_codon:yes gene_type:complete
MYWIILGTILLTFNTVFAKETCDIQSIKSFYEHIESSSPIVLETAKAKERIDSEVDLAKQRPNPEISAEYLKGDEFGLDINTVSLTAEHVFEFGSKRDKRLARANAFKKLNESQINLDLFSKLANYTLTYQKISQLNILIESVKEAIRTFNRIVDKLSSRSSLTPEETISLSTIALASNEYKSQLNDLENEKVILKGRVEFVSNCSDLEISHVDLKYPELNHKMVKNVNQGLTKLEDLKITLANEEVEVQKSLGYSNILVGPSIEYQKQGNDEFLAAGVAVSFALPLFHTNNGGKLQAMKGLQQQKIESLNNKKMLSIETRNLYQKYNRSFNTYKSMPSLKQLEQKHLQVERLYSRGIVSIPMTIESHRQQIDFLTSRFETENDLLSTFVRISLIEGNINKFKELLK